ncbi:MAG TPA: [Fe-Fe] hydrogenase large subunit C-terminal domain-containing protein [Anaeromyxobacteraceae bacterium]|nr:[Fe-Fe] hydrogenase large subunit C-terminal domain-containing protein [Anaeromyxobacteraceae bacterium]
MADPDLCIDCGECLRWCRHGAVHAATATPADLRRFKYTVALPTLTLYSQFGKDVEPGQVLLALRSVGFDDVYDLSAMCDMHASATDAYLSECRGPWPKISVTCPAVIRLIQLRYPDMIENLLPIETPRELAAKLLRRRLVAEKGLDPGDIGIFLITPCSAMLQSIHHPETVEASYMDGAFSIAEFYGPLLKAIKANGRVENPPPISARGLLWAMAGGEIAGLRNANTITVGGVRDVLRVFDHIEEGKLQAVDFIEAYACPDGCISGQLTVEGRYAARRTVQQIVHRSGQRAGEGAVALEEKVRAMLREHFFDLEEHLKARPLRPLGRDLREAAARKQEEKRVLAELPGKNCAACGAPGCAAHAEDVVRGQAALEDCVFIRIARLQEAAACTKESVHD